MPRYILREAQKDGSNNFTVISNWADIHRIRPKIFSIARRA
jgi:hypothetical protein